MVAETEIGGTAGEFPATRWTLILSSTEGIDRRRKALQELLGLYWKPLARVAFDLLSSRRRRISRWLTSRWIGRGDPAPSTDT